MSDFELDVDESGKTWITKHVILTRCHLGDILVHPDFPHDSATFAPNLLETNPDLPPHLFFIVHDALCRYRIWANGTPVTRRQADAVMRTLMKASNNPIVRTFATLYWIGVRLAGWWYWRKPPLEIPKMYSYMYGNSEEAWKLRAQTPIIVVNQLGRLDIMPSRIG
jgi:hypothetical protein